LRKKAWLANAAMKAAAPITAWFALHITGYHLAGAMFVV